MRREIDESFGSPLGPWSSSPSNWPMQKRNGPLLGALEKALTSQGCSFDWQRSLSGHLRCSGSAELLMGRSVLHFDPNNPRPIARLGARLYSRVAA